MISDNEILEQYRKAEEEAKRKDFRARLLGLNVYGPPVKIEDIINATL